MHIHTCMYNVPPFLCMPHSLVLITKNRTMREEVASKTLIIQLAITLVLSLRGSYCSPFRIVGSDLLEVKHDALSPEVSPAKVLQPFLPLVAPSPLMPFTNNSVPALSGLCNLNFSAAGTILNTTATDCWDPLAPYLANVVCCPQFQATIVILIGQSSIYSRKLALNLTHATHCLSDVEQILESQGANTNLQNICSIYPSNLTELSCPIMDVDEIESILDFSRLSAACKEIDSVNECCSQVCQNAVSDAAQKVARQNHGKVSLSGAVLLPAQSSVVDDCKNIVLRWLTSKLDPSSANAVLRGLSNCNVNKVCPLIFHDINNVTQECGEKKSNLTACCKAMKNYMSQMQEQSFITNLQAMNCAATLGKKLQRANISRNIYTLCDINLKDFSLRVGSQDSGCLFPSLPSDVSYDQNTGISFICDLNDNLEASWPSTSFVPGSSCNQTIQIPVHSKTTSAQSGMYIKEHKTSLLFSSFLVLFLLI